MIQRSRAERSRTRAAHGSSSIGTQLGAQNSRSRWITGRPVRMPSSRENTDFPAPPLPMTATRFTIATDRAARSSSARGDEAVEDGERVERARRAFWVVLDRLDRLVHVTEALDRAVVEVDLADAPSAVLRQGRADHLDLVILRGHL